MADKSISIENNGLTAFLDYNGLNSPIKILNGYSYD